MTDERIPHGLRVVRAGPGVTLQDGGRHGFLRYGVTVAGPMDPLAHATANRALGRPAGAAAIEVSLGGLEVEAEGGAVDVAVAGVGFAVSLDGQTLAAAAAATLTPGARLAIKAGEAGAWCTLAVDARIDVAPALGSLATHLRSGLGGLSGRALATGDLVPLAEARASGREPARLLAPWLDRPGDVIRVVPGPQDDYFAAEAIAAFLAGPWTASPASDRMGVYLDGPPVAHARGHDIVSDAVAMGSIQVPGAGRPVVLMADRQPTGGYPKIATVIGADLGRLAQLRPGATFRFAAVDLAAAVTARRAEAAALAGPIAAEPFRRTRLESAFLLGLNLIDGVTAAGAPGSEERGGGE